MSIYVVLKDKNFLVFAIFRKWKNELLHTAFICEDMDMVLSKMAPIFLTESDWV